MLACKNVSASIGKVHSAVISYMIVVLLTTVYKSITIVDLCGWMPTLVDHISQCIL